ncbi:sialate O-acetylesterase [Planctomycetota bacterium]
MIKRSSKLLSILVVTGVFLFNAAIVAAQPAATGQRGQKGGGIARLLQQAGATREQIKQFNDARSELRNTPNYRAALQAKLKSILTEQQYDKFEEVWRNRGQSQSKSASVPAPEGANKWKTAGLQQANTMGIIKVASGGTGIRGFEKNWSFERAERTFDGQKGSLYQDLMRAVAEARRISKPEFCGFVWRQAKADGTRRDLAEEYCDTFKQLISDLRNDLRAPELPVFILAHSNDEDLLQVVLSHPYDQDMSKARKLSAQSPCIGTVIMAHNRVGREIPNVVTLYPGKLPISEDGVHTNAEGQMILGKVTASGVEEFCNAYM